MYFKFEPGNFGEILAHYDRHGFAVLTHVEPTVAVAFRRVIAQVTGLTDDQIRRAGREPVAISAEARMRLARPDMTGELREVSLSVFGRLLGQMLGPIVHVSHSYHPQIKGGAREDYILKGYSGDGLEVEAPYGLHQDFTAARVVTSPSAVVFWVPLNSCESNSLRLYEKSRACGLLANRWLPPNVAGIERLGPHVDVRAEEGHVLMFNFLVLHGTSNPGRQTRISCDLRFFPFCGILDSAAKVLHPSPIQWMRERLGTVTGETLTAPLYETLAYLGEPVVWPEVRRHSVLHWARYIEAMATRDADGMAAAIEAFANTETGFDDVDTYRTRFTALKLEPRPYGSVQPSLSALEQRRCHELLARHGVEAAAAGSAH